MANWYDQINLMTFTDIATQCGHSFNTKQNRFRDCPACGATKEKSLKRPPVGCFGKNQYEMMWECNVCHVRGNKFDIVSYYMYSRPASELESFAQLKGFVVAQNYCNLKKSPRIIEPPPPPEYPPLNEVQAILTKGCTPLHKANIPRKLDDYLKSRGLDKNKIPCGYLDKQWDGWEKLTKVESSNGRQTQWWPGEWAIKFPLIFSLVDYKGVVRSFLGRTWYDYTIQKYKRKTNVPISYTTQDLLLANQKARDWMKHKHIEEHVLITEGEMDYATACQEVDTIVIGIRSGSIDVVNKLPWTPDMKAHIMTDWDQKGEKYAKQLAKNVGRAIPMRADLHSILGEENE